jgi:hypothetical protein
MPSTICKNCAHHYKGNFCPNCGQSVKVEPIGVKYFLHDIPHSIFHIDKGFFYTLKCMFTNPGKAIKEYLEGKRIQHFRPFAFVIIMSTICTLIVPQLEKLMITLYEKNNLGRTLVYKTVFWEKYISLFIFLMIPLLSLVTWLTFKNKKYNYWEHFLGNTYIAALLNILLVCIKLFGVVKTIFGYHPSVNFTFFMFIFMFYYSYCFRVWMAPHKGRWHLFGKLLIMNFFLSLIYITGFSLSGIMSPWWGK